MSRRRSIWGSLKLLQNLSRSGIDARRFELWRIKINRAVCVGHQCPDLLLRLFFRLPTAYLAPKPVKMVLMVLKMIRISSESEKCLM